MPVGHNRGGFTLIELLVVIVIMAVLLTVAVLQVGGLDRGKDLETHARRMTDLIRLASSEAVLMGRETGLRVESDGYRFLVLADTDQGTRWMPFKEKRTYRPRTFPEGVRAEVIVEGQQIDLEDEEATEEGDDTPSPQVALFSSGMMTPFEIRFRRDGEIGEVVLEGSITGKLEIRNTEEPS